METPDPATTAQLSAATAATVVLAGLLLTGPLLSVVPLGEPATAGRLGDGTATVSSVSLTGPVTLTDGRFGTGVRYVRIPEAVVTVDSVSGRSRLVYRIVVPKIGVEASATKPLGPGATGTHRLSIRDQAVSNQTTNGPYAGHVTVKVQSFEGETVVLARNVSVGGNR